MYATNKQRNVRKKEMHRQNETLANCRAATCTGIPGGAAGGWDITIGKQCLVYWLMSQLLKFRKVFGA